MTDSGLSRRGTLHDVAEALRAGCKIIQYREKSKETRAMAEEASAIKKLCENCAIFIVNDRIDVALAVDADGVHIGQDDMPYQSARRILGHHKIIGVTVHDAAEAEEAESDGADYVGLSPIFATATKDDAGEACGLAMVRTVRAAIDIPIAAIGGISLDNVGDVIGAGADCVCAISAVVCAEDVYEQTMKFREIIRKES